jgi:thiol-disulfide isomerase/thioredoxin
MIERTIVVLILLVLGTVLYCGLRRYHVRRAAINAPHDPILRDLRPNIPTIVYFTTPSCIPCRTQQKPALSRLQSELGDNIQIIEIDAVDNPEAADRWGVFSAPTTFVLDAHGQPREVNHGVADANKLKQQILAAAV